MRLINAILFLIIMPVTFYSFYRQYRIVKELSGSLDLPLKSNVFSTRSLKKIKSKYRRKNSRIDRFINFLSKITQSFFYSFLL